MNEHTKSLAMQYAHKMGNSVLYNAEHMEAFAELIVRECAEVCADRGKMHDGLYSAWADDCSKRIGKHFGVEE